VNIVVVAISVMLALVVLVVRGGGGVTVVMSDSLICVQNGHCHTDYLNIDSE